MVQPIIPHSNHYATLDNNVHCLDESLIDHEKRKGSRDTWKLGEQDENSCWEGRADDQICNKRRCTRQMKFGRNR